MDWINTLVDRIPPGAWLAVGVGNIVVTLATWSAAARRLRRAGQRAADPTVVAGRAAVRDTALTVAALVPAVLFWTMVLAGSLHGLVAFGRQTLDWHDGWEYLVPGTLDGVSVTFAFQAFRAVRRGKAPDRCYRVVWGAALASATVNFAYEYSHSGRNIIAGGYLGLLGLFGMVLFHEFLDQFEDGTASVRRDNPKFGLRWLTWPTNTFCAAVAWRNHPPADGTPATVMSAVANLERVRAAKRAVRQDRISARHTSDMNAAGRRAELAAARATVRAAIPRQPAPSRGREDADGCPPVTAASFGPAAVARVSTTAPAVAQWVATWAEMCADGDMVHGPLNDEGTARARHALSARQLRNIRNAAWPGILRQRAAELGVPLPPEYTDAPTSSQINGRSVAALRHQ